MKRLASLAVLGGTLGVAQAKVLKWSPDYETERWLPAQQTMAAMLDLRGMSPKPTPGPKLVRDIPPLLRRDSTDNTCAYIGGQFTSSLYCSETDACVYNSARSFVGCCPESSIKCPIPTKCYDSTDSASFTTENGYTLYCGDVKYNHCITHLYANDDPLFSGYTLLGCAIAGGSDTVYYDAKGTSVSKTLKAGNTDTTATGVGGGVVITYTVDPNAQSSSTSPPSSGGGGGGGGSSTPIGPIVGGVVGGVALLALIGLAIWLIVRRSNKKKNTQPPAQSAAAVAPGGASPPGPGGPAYSPQQPPIGQYPPAAGGWDANQQHQQQYANQPGGFYDPRASIAKPPYDAHSSVYQPTYAPTSPPGSPPPPQSPHTPGDGYAQGNTPPAAATHYSNGYAVSNMTGAQSPPGVHTQQQQGFPNTSPGGQAQTQTYHYAAELPTTRGDGEVRELA